MADIVGRRALPSPADDAETPIGLGSGGRRGLPAEPDQPTGATGRRAARGYPEDRWDDAADDEPTGRFALAPQPQGRFAFTPPPADAPRPGRAARSTDPEQPPAGRFALTPPPADAPRPGRAARSADPETDDFATDDPEPGSRAVGRFALAPPPADAPRPGQRGRFGQDDEPFSDDEPTGRFAAIETTAAPVPPAWTPPAAVAATLPQSVPAFPLSAATPVRPPQTAPSASPAPWDPQPAPAAVETPEPADAAELPADVAELRDGYRQRAANPMVVDRHPWRAVAVAATAVAMMVTTVFVGIGGNSSIAAPGSQPSTPAAATAPTNAPSEGQAPTTGGDDTQAPTIEGDPWPVGSGLPATQDPGESTAPRPSAPPTAEPVVLDLGAAQVPVLPGWQLYADEQVQDSRRLIRIRNVATDTRIQVVALPGVTGPLTEACTDLINDHRASYTGVALSMAVSVPVAAGAEGVACSFVGTRTSDNVATRVDFTVVRRDSDATSLIFRDTIPQSVPGNSPARSELVRIECAAADSFGVTISQCAVATPGQAGG